MLYFLSRLSDFFGPFRLFEYVTFRAGGAAVTAFLLTVILGGATANLLKSLHAQSADRYAGVLAPELIDKAKNRTPCMGGVLIVGAVVLAALLWCVPGRISGILIAGTILFALTGFIDDWIKVVHQNRNGLPGKLKLLMLTVIAAGVVVYLNFTPGVGGMMQQFIVPFFKNPFNIGAVDLVVEELRGLNVIKALDITVGECLNIEVKYKLAEPFVFCIVMINVVVICDGSVNFFVE